MSNYIKMVDGSSSYLEHYGRKGMKWGEHIYTKDDIKRLKKFMRSKDAKEIYRRVKRDDKRHYLAKAGYKQGIFSNRLDAGENSLTRYTSRDEKKLSKRSYFTLHDTQDDLDYKDMAKRGALGSKEDTVYKDRYDNTKTLKIAKASRVAEDIIKKYGDKNMKEMWKMYKDLHVHDLSGYIFDTADEDYGWYAKNGQSTPELVKNGEDMFAFKQQMGRDFNKLLYKANAARTYVDDKYSKKYDAIEDAEDWMYGIGHPMIIYDGSEKLTRKSHRKIQ